MLIHALVRLVSVRAHTYGHLGGQSGYGRREGRLHVLHCHMKIAAGDRAPQKPDISAPSWLKASRRSADLPWVALFRVLGHLAAIGRAAAQLSPDLSTGEETGDLATRITKLEARPLTVAEAASVLGVAEKTVRRRIAAGTLAATRTGRRVVVHLDQDPVRYTARRARP